MTPYDCVVLYNAAILSEREGCQEQIYPANLVREEVSAIEESLRGGGYHPCVIAVENFTRDLVQTLTEMSPKFIFNLCEEINGRSELEMCMAGLLELMNIPYTGPGILASAIGTLKLEYPRLSEQKSRELEEARKRLISEQ